VKGFKFKLQSVLEIREKKFEDSQLEFALANNELHQEKLKKANIIQTLENTISGLEEVLSAGSIDQTIIFIHQNYIVKLKGDIITQENVIKKAEEKLAEKNRQMLEALKEKKVMEKLKEKALSEFKSNIERHEMLQIDEIATNRHKRAF